MIKLNTYRQVVFCIVLLPLLWCLTGCAIFTKDRVLKHRGIRKLDSKLPIITYPSEKSDKKTMVLYLSGDGGWLDFSDDLAVALSENGFNTVGFNSRSYFWNKKSLKQIGLDFSQLIHEYLQTYDSKSIILCGYSFGADVVPFIYNNLNFREKNKVKSLVLLSPFASTDFVVYTTDLLNLGGDNREFKVIKEVERITLPISCYYGEDESRQPLSVIKKKRFQLFELQGGHGYTESAIPFIISNILKRHAQANQD